MKRPDLFDCEYPSCDNEELDEGQITHYSIRVNSPGNPGTEVLDFDLCDDHSDKLSTILDDYRS